MGKKKEKQVVDGKLDIDNEDGGTCRWLVLKGIGVSFLCISLFALLVRVVVSLHPYSGAGDPPKFGDYEAQRHWMEITHNLPVLEWYRNSTTNDLSCWGLDYPPLSAYQSYFHGLFLRFFDPDSVALFTSRGHETYLGFVVNIVVARMSAYFAPAFFSLLLGKCLRQKNPLFEVTKLGLVVLGTFTVVWWPYLHSTDSLLLVLSRLASFERGIYEDYVANFWCASSILIKWKRLFTIQSLKLISLTATVLTCLPSMIQQVLAPSCIGFLYGLLNSSISFYFFSFQVHEKSILLLLLPAILLALEEPRSFGWFTQNALFSMFPLLCRDKLVLPYMDLYALFILVYCAPGGPRFRPQERETCFPASIESLITGFVYLCYFLFHIAYLTVHPPEEFPYLLEALIMLLCFSQFMSFAVYTNMKQWLLLRRHSTADKEKKQHMILESLKSGSCIH